MGNSSRAESGEDVENENLEVIDRWRQLVRHARRVRQLQRLYGYLGQVLATYDAGLRRRLRDVDPTDYQRRHGRR